MKKQVRGITIYTSEGKTFVRFNRYDGAYRLREIMPAEEPPDDTPTSVRVDRIVNSKLVAFSRQYVHPLGNVTVEYVVVNKGE